MGLKALAMLALQRDSERDRWRDRPSEPPGSVSHGGGTSGTASGTAGGAKVVILADLRAAMAARAAALEGIMDADDVAEERSAVLAVDG